MTPGQATTNAIILAIVNMLGVAIVEELLFRGFIFQRLIDGVGQWPAQVIVAGMFFLTHLGNAGMTGVSGIIGSLNIITASLLLGIAFIKTKGLAMPIGLHFMANVIQGPILGFGVSGNHEASVMVSTSIAQPWITGGQFGLEGSIVGLMTILGLTIWCSRTQKNLT